MSGTRKAIVTGASSGIGRAICKELCELGYEVYGIGRDFSREEDLKEEQNTCDTHNLAITQIECDITNTQLLEKTIKDINKNHDVTLLVNNAGVGFYGLHEELNATKISKMVRTNFEAPMIITSLLLRDLKANHGTIINISSVTADKTNPHGCAYGATKAGLASFSRSLFEEARKYGVRVVNVEPDMTATNLYRNADFKASDDVMASLSPEEVAEVVSYILKQREGLVVTDITIRPQLHRLSKKNK